MPGLVTSPPRTIFGLYGSTRCSLRRQLQHQCIGNRSRTKFLGTRFSRGIWSLCKGLLALTKHISATLAYDYFGFVFQWPEHLNEQVEHIQCIRRKKGEHNCEKKARRRRDNRCVVFNEQLLMPDRFSNTEINSELIRGNAKGCS